MQKNDEAFDRLEVLPFETTDDIAAKFDKEIRDRLKKEIDGMFSISGHPLYAASNRRLLEWMKVVADGASIRLRELGDDFVLECNLVQEPEWDEFSISTPLNEVLDDAVSWFGEFGFDAPEARKRIASLLREAADAIDG